MLPYSDWVKINNAQRCHENYVSHLPVLYSCVFINSLSFPKFTFYSMLAYMCARVAYTRGYMSFRGYNKAIAPDEIQSMILRILILSSILSSFKIMKIVKWYLFMDLNLFIKFIFVGFWGFVYCLTFLYFTFMSIQ